jgi:amino acid adenylation domain-containing protein
MNRLEFRLASPEDAPKVEAFNRRLVEAGETYHSLTLQKPFRTMAHIEDSPITVEKLFCFEGDEIRGGVSIKRMQFVVNGRAEEVATSIYPLSEGVVNRSYGMIGLMIEEELLRRYPLLYGLGAPNTLPAMVRRHTGWFRTPVPFYFKVFRASPFLKNISYLRRSTLLRTLFETAASTGLGSLGLSSLELVQKVLGHYPRTAKLHIERFDQWENWADEIWEGARDSYALIGDRSKAALQSLYPSDNERLIKLRITSRDSQAILGWAVLTLAQMKDHKYFGNMALAALVDMLAVPEDALSIVGGALAAARQADADLLVVNHSDERWNRAFRLAGMLPWKSNYYLSISPQLKERFDTVESDSGRFYFTRGDGHGPTRLWLSDDNFNEAELEFSGNSNFKRTKDRSYLQQKLAKPVEPIKFYGAMPPERNAHTRRTAHEIDSERSQRLKAIATQEGQQTLDSGRQVFSVFATIIFAYLYRISGNSQLRIGCTVAEGSIRHEKRDVPARVYPLQIEITDGETFISLLHKVTAATEEVISHFIGTDADLQINGSYDVLYNFQNGRLDSYNDASDRINSRSEVSRGGLGLHIQEVHSQNRYLLHLEFNADVFDEVRSRRSIGHFMNVLDGFLRDRKQPIKQVDLLSEEEKRYLSQELNATQMDYPRHASLHKLFEVQAERIPEGVAVVFQDKQMTYGELNRRANQLAQYLRSAGVGPDTLVGICVERSADMVVGLLGILKAGGAYVPLDPAYPRQRLAYMLSDSQAAVLVTERRLAEALPEHGAQIVYLDDDWHVISRLSAEDLGVPVQPHNRAYVIYTSGSTGKPKGVQIPHCAAVNFLKSMEQVPGLTSDDVLMAVTTLSFDIHVLEIFLPLILGGRVIILGREAVADGRQLIENLDTFGATVMQATPVTWRLLLGAGWQGNRRLKVLCGGEAFPRELADQLLEKCDSLWNMYGPTETTVWSAVHRVTSGEGNVPIGRPIANTQVYVLDETLQMQPMGVPGELYIGGDGLALGYLNRPDLTAERFIAHPFSRDKKARLYKTGDLARYLPSGELECLGRLDHQVKIRGFRIELGEVETAISAHPDLRQAAVIAWEDVPGDKRLVAYMVANGHHKPSVSEIRNFLKDKLPDYMIPAIFVFLDAMPLTPNRKVDRKSLPAPERLLSAMQADYVEPRNYLERFLAETWCSVLQMQKIGIHDNFFELGGDSLRGAIFINKLQQKLDEYVYVVALFDSPSIAEFAAYLQNRYPAAVARVFGDIAAVDEEDAGERIQRVDEAMLRQIRALIPSRAPVRKKDGVNENKNPPAIFILSAPRSGTTLLRVMLAGNPRLFAPPELELLGFNTLKERKSALAGGYRLWSEGTIRAIMEIKSCNADQAKKLMADYENRDLAMSEFYRVLQEWIGERLLIDKSTTYALDLETLKRAEDYFYQPRYIYLSRHPYGMIESFQEVSLDQVFFRYKHDFSPSQLAELIWIVCHQNIQKFLAQVSETRQHRLRYEDLVKRPLEISKELCHFMDIPFHADMARPYKNKERKMTDGIHSVSTMLGDMKFHQHSGIDPTLAERWKESLEEDFLSDIAWEIAEKLGYSRLNVKSNAEH